MIYSPAFAALPAAARDAVYTRMSAVLEKRGDTTVIEILEGTLPSWSTRSPSLIPDP